MEQQAHQVAAMDLFALLPPERWQAESLAYLDSAGELFGRMSTGEFQSTWPRAKSAAFLFSHGLELFFKAAIAQAGEVFLWGHDLERLHVIYRKYFPGSDFVLQPDVAGFVQQNAPIPFYDFLKYPERIEEINQTWPAGIYIDPQEWHRNVSTAAAEVRRVWPLVLVAFPRDFSRWQDNTDGDLERTPRKKKATAETLYVLQHVRGADDSPEDVKMIGIYSELPRAEAAIERLRAKPGFRDAQDGFAIDEYVVDRDHWSEGYGASD